MPIFLLVILGVYLLLNLWILIWFWRALRGGGAGRLLVCLVLLALITGSIGLFLSTSTAWWCIAWLRAGTVWMGSYFYIFVLTLLASLLGLFRRLFFHAPRRDRSAPRWKAAGAILGIALVLAAGGWINAAWPVLREESLVVATDRPGMKPITIAALSDMHLGRVITANRFARALNLLAPHKPDLLLFLGDVLDDHLLLDEAAMRAAIAQVAPPLGAWGILGNHEYYSGEIGSLAILERCGIEILRDEWAAFDHTLLLVGRDDYSREGFSGEARMRLTDILATVPANERDLPILLMDHQPQQLAEAEQAGVALQLSGHTHKAQLWPFNLLLPLIYENPAGWSRRGDTRYFVSVGAGTWGPPLRNNARPEVLLLRVEFVEKAP